VDGTHGMPKHVGEECVHLLCIYPGISHFSSVIFHFSAYCIALNNIYTQKYGFSAQKDKNGEGGVNKRTAWCVSFRHGNYQGPK